MNNEQKYSAGHLVRCLDFDLVIEQMLLSGSYSPYVNTKSKFTISHQLHNILLCS